MNFFLVSYENYGANGRLREFISCFERIGEVYSFFLNYHGEKTNLKIQPNCLNVKIGYKLKNPITFVKFIFITLWEYKKNSPVDYLVICNTPACISGYFLRLLHPKMKIIYDAYELKLPENRKKIMERLFSWFEQKIIRKAEIVICANEERAQIMKKFYGLESPPIVFENIRKIEESGEFREHIKSIINNIDKSKLNLISTGGYDIERGSDALVAAMREFENNAVLYIVGGGANADRVYLENIMLSKNIKNVIITGMVNRKELNSLLEKCDIGIVQYHQKDLNNKYCASGKIYEYIEKGLAVVTTTNPPLVGFCNKYKVGIADDNYVEGINKVVNELEVYKRNALDCSKLFTPIENNNKFVATLSKLLKVEEA